MKNCREITNLVKVGRKYRALYMKSYVGFEVADKVNSSRKRSLRVKWYKAVRIAKEEYA
jgi:hypothetical protein